MKTLMGIDLGTTGLKVSLFSEAGLPIGSAYVEYPILTPEPGFAEQDPQLWWTGFISACHELQMKFPAEYAQVLAIGLCGQMHTQVYLDRNDQVLRPAITWMDQRSSKIIEAIQSEPGALDLIFRETSNFPSTTYTAAHMRWVMQNEPEVWAKTEHVLVAKDYLKFLLTGEMATDYAEASGTLLFNVVEERWSDDAFAYFQVPRNFLPPALPSDVIIGRVSAEAARLTGIKEGTPVANGSSDNSASALGAGMVRPGQVTLIIGTAGVITVLSDHPLVDHLNRTLCWHYCLRERWVTLGILQTAGESLNWFKNAFDAIEGAPVHSGDVFERYNQSILNVPDGSDGLIFLPYLNGERTPYWDPAARGVFFGVNLRTEKAHFIKAIMEGVSFALRNNIETVESLGVEISELRAVGGGLKSRAWLETLAKITRKPLSTVSVGDTANLGNILLAGHALGVFPDYEETIPKLATTGQQVSFPDGSDVYERQYGLFLELYQDLKGAFRKLN